MLRRFAAAAFALIVCVLIQPAPPTLAQDFVPAILFDMGGKFDKSFNEAAYNGAERFKKETGIAYREFEITNEAQRTQALQRLARRGGGGLRANIVGAIGFAFTTPLTQIAKEFPD